MVNSAVRDESCFFQRSKRLICNARSYMKRQGSKFKMHYARWVFSLVKVTLLLYACLFVQVAPKNLPLRISSYASSINFTQLHEV